MLKFVRLFFQAVLVAAIFFSATATAETFFAQVRFCIDGDTVVVRNNRKVRLAGIDTPEKASEGIPAQYYARESQQLTQQLVLHQQVKIVPVSGTGKDRYGRLVAEVFLPDGSSLNEQLLRKGAAYFYDHKELSDSMRRRFLSAQAAALTERTGFWKHMLERPEAGDAFIGNRKSRRFFSVPCSGTVRIAPRNRVLFPDLETAFRNGYAPVRSCSIWPYVTEKSR